MQNAGIIARQPHLVAGLAIQVSHKQNGFVRTLSKEFFGHSLQHLKVSPIAHLILRTQL